MAVVGSRQSLVGVDRVIFLLNQSTIRDLSRLHKYAFLASQLYRDELKPLGFYSEWRAYYHGPYSTDLQYDLYEANNLGLIQIESREIDGLTVSSYRLRTKGAQKLPRLMDAHGDIIKRMRETFASLDKKTLDEIHDEIYRDYPEHAKNSKMAVAAGVPLDPGDDMRLSPETERLLEENESGTGNWETCSIDEHIKYVKRLMRD